MPQYIGIKFSEPFPLFCKGEHRDAGNAGPFYAADSVIQWHVDTPQARAHLAQASDYWAARGYTPSLETLSR